MNTVTQLHKQETTNRRRNTKKWYCYSNGSLLTFETKTERSEFCQGERATWPVPRSELGWYWEDVEKEIRKATSAPKVQNAA